MTGSAADVRAYLNGRDAACSHCGYNLRDCPSPRCPECGETIRLSALMHRHKIVPRNDLRVVSIVGLCGALVATMFLAPAMATALGAAILPLASIIVLGLLLGEAWVLVSWVWWPGSFTRLARPVQWMAALTLGGAAAAAAVCGTILIFTVFFG